MRIRPPSRRRFWRADATVIALVAATVLVLGLSSSTGSSPHDVAGVPAAVTVNSGTELPGTRPIPLGFLGISLEYPAVEAYAGNDPQALNPVFEQLIRNLGPAPELRIGGDSADWTWWPVAGLTRPPGVTFTLDERWLSVTRALARSLGARLILGINLEAASTQVAAAEASALTGGIGASSIEAFELGNEPELYGSFAWYRTPDGRTVTGRPHDYDFNAFSDDFTAVGGAVSEPPLAGPSFGGLGWIGHVAEFLRAEPRVRVVTLHRYPLQLCFTKPGSPRYPTIANLLSDRASAGLADGFVGAAGIAHAHGLPVRIDELNTVACGADAAISNTFASALWSLDTLFQMARVGIDGVNIHTFPGAGYELFRFIRAGGRWRGSVAPQYYGLLMFAQAAPPGSQLLSDLGHRGGPAAAQGVGDVSSGRANPSRADQQTPEPLEERHDPSPRRARRRFGLAAESAEHQRFKRGDPRRSEPGPVNGYRHASRSSDHRFDTPERWELCGGAPRRERRPRHVPDRPIGVMTPARPARRALDKSRARGGLASSA